MFKIFLLSFLFLVGNAWAESVEQLKVKAEQGDLDAQYTLGSIYFNWPDKSQAAKWYRLAAAQGDRNAQYSLGDMYLYGDGINQDDDKAIKWFRLAAKQGHVLSQRNLGRIYDRTSTYREAVKWYSLAACQEDASSQSWLGRAYHYGRGVPQSDKEAVKWYRLAAEQGDSRAQNSLGLFYLQGIEVIQDYKKAHMWFNIAAVDFDGRARANRIIAESFMSKQDVSKAQDMAREWTERKSANSLTDEAIRLAKLTSWGGEKRWIACQQAHQKEYESDENGYSIGLTPSAEEENGEIYLTPKEWMAQQEAAVAKTSQSTQDKNTGDSIFVHIWTCRDSETSSEQFADRQMLIGANQGDENKQLKLAQALQIGKGCIKQDQLAAIHWYKKAANQGNLDAQLALAAHYVMPSSADKAVESNHAEAFKWSSMAAQQGSKIGQADLAFLYVMNQGIQYDPIKSLMWATIAGTEFNQRLGNLEKALTTEVLDTSQITEARNLAKQCVKKQFKDC